MTKPLLFSILGFLLLSCGDSAGPTPTGTSVEERQAHCMSDMQDRYVCEYPAGVRTALHSNGARLENGYGISLWLPTPGFLEMEWDVVSFEGSEGYFALFTLRGNSLTCGMSVEHPNGDTVCIGEHFVVVRMPGQKVRLTYEIPARPGEDYTHFSVGVVKPDNRRYFGLTEGYYTTR